jgi:hypothetical protein
MTKLETPERMVMGASYHDRDNALQEVTAGIERILHPRSGYQSYGGSSVKHFLPIPKAPEATINRAGMPGQPPDKELEAFRKELETISLREQELVNLAGKVKNMTSPLLQWGIALGVEEDHLLVSTLSEEDRPEVESYIREHKRFLRTCHAWADKLRF